MIASRLIPHAPLVCRHTEAAVARSSAAIVLLTELYPPAIGGSAVLFHEIYSRVSGRARITVLTDPSSSPFDPDLADTLPTVRLPIATKEWGLASLRALGHHVKVAGYLREVMRNRRNALVHCGRALPEGVAAFLGYAVGGSPYICWSHGEDVETARASRELTWVMRTVYKNAAAVLANSRSTERMLQALGVAPSRIEVVYPGVDADRFRPGVDGEATRGRVAPHADLVLLSVGRLQRRKGHDLAIQAVARLKDQIPGLCYVIVGDGDERARLGDLARTEGVTDRVIFAGAVAPHELPGYYAACDVFLLPNRRDGLDVEGFGIVFLEAAASARPAIGGSTGGVPEAVEDGETGLLVSGTDVEELAAAIRRLAEAPDLRRRLGDRGRQRVMARFTWERGADAVSAVHARAAARLRL